MEGSFRKSAGSKGSSSNDDNSSLLPHSPTGTTAPQSPSTMTTSTNGKNMQQDFETSSQERFHQPFLRESAQQQQDETGYSSLIPLPPSISQGDDHFPKELLLQQIMNPYIDDDSPAAEALRANAEVHVAKMSKVARSINAQAIRKFVKRATMRNHYGNVRGKPPRLPPGIQRQQEQQLQLAQYGVADDAMGLIQEGTAEDDSKELVSKGTASSKSAVDEQDFASCRSHSSSDSDDSAGMVEDRKAPQQQQPQSPVPVDDNEGSSSLMLETLSTGSVKLPLSPLQSKKPPDMSPPASPHSARSSLAAVMNSGQQDIPAEVVEGTMEAGRKVMKSVDPHDILKLTRWRRKKKKGNKKDRKSYVVGKVIDGQHELYAQAIAIMLGVRTSIAKTNGLITADAHKQRWLTPDDFNFTEKYEFRPGGSKNTPPHQLSHTFKFKDYSPIVFAYLRRLFGVNEFDFLLSVCGNANFIEFISNAKSGQFFFYSSDGRYMIKTMTNAESKFLRRMLPDYFRHCCANPNTMLTKFCGMYRVKLYHLRKNVKFVIMNSVYYTEKYMQEFFDLKGSILGRTAKPGDAVKKDNDLRDRLPESSMALPPELRDRARRQLIRDCNFLQRMQVMDYSMLVGVHHIPTKESGIEGGYRGSLSSRRSSTVPHRKNTGNSYNSMNLGDTNASVRNSESPRASSSRPTGSVGAKPSDTACRSLAELNESHLGPPVSMFDDLLDEDDSSYLEGSDKRGSIPSTPSVLHSDIEKKKLQTIEQIYWPFHRLYDIHGHRRLKPGPCYHCRCVPCQCEAEKKILKEYNIPEFVAPLSDRKDGGFMMDTRGLDLPKTFKTKDGKEQQYEGKIFYMGIIDILQEYTSRKKVESQYHLLQGMDALEASCVAPRDYAARFIKFFDIYSQRKGVVPAADTIKKAAAKSIEGIKVNLEQTSRRADEGIEVEAWTEDRLNESKTACPS